MLPAGSRLRHRADFSAVTRARGARGDGLLVVHLRRAPADGADDPGAPDGRGGSVRVGLVVPRSVGPAVTRNRVKRRLRHLLAGRLHDLPAGAAVVVRALPPAGTASRAALTGALDQALRSAVTGPVGGPRPGARR